MTLPSFKNARPFLAAALLPIFAAGCAQWSDRMSDVNGSTSEAAHSAAEGPGRIVSEDASFALRVADEMELPLKDAPSLEARIALSEDPTVWFADPVEPEPLISLGSWGSLGLEKAIAFGKSFFESEPDPTKNRILAYIPAKDAADGREALKLLSRSMEAAMRRAALETGWHVTLERPAARTHFDVKGYSASSIRFADLSRGCPSGTASSPETEVCTAKSVVVDAVADSPARAPEWTGLGDEPMWRIGEAYLYVTSPEGVKIDFMPFVEAFLRALPEGVYLYAAPSPVDGIASGKTLWRAPYVLDARGRHDFVKRGR